MSEQADIEQLADEVSPWSASIAARLRAVAWRVGRLERAADELVDDANNRAGPARRRPRPRQAGRVMAICDCCHREVNYVRHSMWHGHAAVAGPAFTSGMTAAARFRRTP